MKFPVEWLKDYLVEPQTDRRLSDLLTDLGFEAQIGAGCLTVEITPNRGDLLSVYGLAREIGAATNQKIRPLFESPKKPLPKESLSRIKVSLQTPAENLPFYAGLVFEDLEKITFPKNFTRRLLAAGFRPISPIVDLTNYLMVLTGAPSHAFDLDKIARSEFIVSESRKGDRVVTLDGKSHDLPEGSFVVKDGLGLIDLAGIMGGKRSATDRTTTRVYLHFALYHPSRIRKTAKATISTEASLRFERTVDSQAARSAFELARVILSGLGAREVEAAVLRATEVKKTILLSLKRLNRLLGSDFSTRDAKSALERLGFKTELKAGDEMAVEIPSFRQADIKFDVDLIEEVLRLLGYKKLKKAQFPPFRGKVLGSERDNIISNLAAAGFQQIFGSSLVSRDETEALGFKISDSTAIALPLNKENEVLRPALAIGLLKAAATNPWWPELAFFELGNVFQPKTETAHIGLLTTKGKLPLLKRIFEPALIVEFRPDHSLMKRLKMRRSVFIVELDLLDAPAELKKELERDYHVGSDFQFAAFSNQFPAVRDLSLLVDEQTASKEILDLIKSATKKLLLVELVDQFQSSKIGLGKRSYSFRLVFDGKEPVSETEVAIEMEKIISKLETTFDLKVR